MWGEKETNAREDFHNFLNLADDMVGRGQRTWQARFVFQESLTNLSRDCSTEARPGDEARTRGSGGKERWVGRLGRLGWLGWPSC